MPAPLRDPLDFAGDDGGQDAQQHGAVPRPQGQGDRGASRGAATGLSLGLACSKGGAGRMQPGLLALNLGASRKASLSVSPSASGPSSIAGTPTPDDAVRSTDSDALLSRLSAIAAGYLPPNAFSAELLSAASSAQAGWKLVPGSHAAVPVASHVAARRPPLINVGTYLRCTCMDKRVRASLASSGSVKGKRKGKQVISLGAGSDDRFWRLAASTDPSGNSQHLERYVEVDFPQLTASKIRSISRSAALATPLTNGATPPLPLTQETGVQITMDGTELHAARSGYHLLPIDLRHLAHPPPHSSSSSSDTAPSEARAVLREAIDPSLPTVVLLECVLSYLEPSTSDALLGWLLRDLLRTCPHVAVLSYDICLGGDLQQRSASDGEQQAIVSEFGQVMLQNLRARRLDIPGAKATTLPHMHAERLRRTLSPLPERELEGNKRETPAEVSVQATSLRSIWEGLDAGERDRLSKVEGLDEVEELNLLLSHYCISEGRRILCT
ncbi:S-adenosyl-L-methionine-dependent methyltransferase [Tilletiaria anomala UBC 951]|uniref:Leucine carboxyl methyltransferase 1 n=1 Tax=Tilletiaria anomala (strain ATCC 24038 / CBS 436.72 / UBC 951) TaxID=1037660 RepID=A0A066WFJ9_TILAU|nr:S-adenosyl-L-methionine-dependent methyltransferase [Tilletiaria anomala UBC 951]KDN52571.1 S-adenosyl-L-methionine-dependent methyltransferase [Tilletiaria anomala UBC 951]